MWTSLPSFLHLNPFLPSLLRNAWELKKWSGLVLGLAANRRIRQVIKARLSSGSEGTCAMPARMLPLVAARHCLLHCVYCAPCSSCPTKMALCAYLWLVTQCAPAAQYWHWHCDKEERNERRGTVGCLLHARSWNCCMPRCRLMLRA